MKLCSRKSSPKSKHISVEHTVFLSLTRGDSLSKRQPPSVKHKKKGTRQPLTGDKPHRVGVPSWLSGIAGFQPLQRSSSLSLVNGSVWCVGAPEVQRSGTNPRQRVVCTVFVLRLLEPWKGHTLYWRNKFSWVS